LTVPAWGGEENFVKKAVNWAGKEEKKRFNNPPSVITLLSLECGEGKGGKKTTTEEGENSIMSPSMRRKKEGGKRWKAVGFCLVVKRERKGRGPIVPNAISHRARFASNHPPGTRAKKKKKRGRLRYAIMEKLAARKGPAYLFFPSGSVPAHTRKEKEKEKSASPALHLREARNASIRRFMDSRQKKAGGKIRFARACSTGRKKER